MKYGVIRRILNKDIKYTTFIIGVVRIILAKVIGLIDFITFLILCKVNLLVLTVTIILRSKYTYVSISYLIN